MYINISIVIYMVAHSYVHNDDAKNPTRTVQGVFKEQWHNCDQFDK